MLHAHTKSAWQKMPNVHRFRHFAARLAVVSLLVQIATPFIIPALVQASTSTPTQISTQAALERALQVVCSGLGVRLLSTPDNAPSDGVPTDLMQHCPACVTGFTHTPLAQATFNIPLPQTLRDATWATSPISHNHPATVYATGQPRAPPHFI